MSNQVVIFFQLLPVCDWLWITNYYPFLMNDFTFISYLKINNLFLIKYFSMASGFIHNITLKKKVHTIAHAIYIFFADMCNMKKTVCTQSIWMKQYFWCLCKCFIKTFISATSFFYTMLQLLFQPFSSLYLKLI